jgi:hypothetical protein
MDLLSCKKRSFNVKWMRMPIKNNREIINKCILVLLGVITVGFLQRCEKVDEDKYHPEFDNSGGMSSLLNELSAAQIKEYVETGKFSSTLKLRAQCYKGYSVISNKKAEVTNILSKKGCQYISVEKGLRKIIILGNRDLDREVVEISCRSERYPNSGLKNKVVEVKLVDDKPVCPIDGHGDIVLPFYRRYSYDTAASQIPQFNVFTLKE